MLVTLKVFMAIFGLVHCQFNSTLYRKRSVLAADFYQEKDSNSHIHCGAICVQDSNCNGFDEDCKMYSKIVLAEGNVSIFVDTDTKNFEEILHFFIVYPNGESEDFSTDEMLSPSIESEKFPSFPASEYLGITKIDDKTLLIQDGTKIYTWEFLSSKDPIYKPEYETLHDHYPGKFLKNNGAKRPELNFLGGVSAASKGGKLVLVGGGNPANKVEIFEDGQWRFLPDLPNNLHDSCVTFMETSEEYFWVTGIFYFLALSKT